MKEEKGINLSPTWRTSDSGNFIDNATMRRSHRHFFFSLPTPAVIYMLSWLVIFSGHLFLTQLCLMKNFIRFYSRFFFLHLCLKMSECQLIDDYRFLKYSLFYLIHLFIIFNTRGSRVAGRNDTKLCALFTYRQFLNI